MLAAKEDGRAISDLHVLIAGDALAADGIMHSGWGAAS